MPQTLSLLANDQLYDRLVWVYASFPLWFTAILSIKKAPYGKFSGPLIARILPTILLPGRPSWFLMEVLSPIIFCACTIPAMLDPSAGWTNPKTILTTLWMAHYFNRSIIYTLRVPSMAPMHFVTLLMAVIFNFLNAYTNGMCIAQYGSYPESLTASPRFWLGVTTWAVGMATNVYHDNILFRLRRDKARKEGGATGDSKEQDPAKRYFIPRGGLFSLVSCPAYFGETVEWIGYATAAWSWPALIFAVSTPANLWPRAYHTHQWYKNTFKDYPKERKAVVPYIW